MSFATYAKAIVGAAVAGCTALVTALDDNAVTHQEWAQVAVATLVALGAIWAVPNAQPVDDGYIGEHRA